MAAGAPAQNAVYVYDCTSLTAPALLLTLTQPNTVQFGTALSMLPLPAPDVGALLIVADNKANGQRGALYVHHLNSTDPSQGGSISAKLVETLSPTSNAGALQFGYPVIASGTFFATSAQGGATVYVFSCTPSGCSQLGNAMMDPEYVPPAEDNEASPPPSTYFGYMLALEMETETDHETDHETGSVPGGTLIAGSFGASSGAGRAYVYRFQGGTWSLTQTLSPLASDLNSPGMTAFGSGVALRAGTAVVAASEGNQGLGSLYVYYCRRGVCGQLQQHILCDDVTACRQSAFGDNALALSGTGTFLAVGGRFGYGGYKYVPVQQPTAGPPQQTIEYLGTGAVWIYSTAPTFSPTPHPTSPTALPSASATLAPTQPSARPSTLRRTPTAGPSKPPTAPPSALANKPKPSSKPTPVPTPTSTSTPKPTSTPTLTPKPTSNPTPGVLGPLPPTIMQSASSQGASQVSSPGEIAGVTVGLLVLVALGVVLFWHCRKRGLLSEDGLVGPDRRPTADTRTPYDIWTEFHDAKREGRLEDYVPPAEVSNPTPPQVLIPGFVDPSKRQSVLTSTMRRLSTTMGLTTNLLATENDGAGPGAELQNVAGPAASAGSPGGGERFDERGSEVRLDALYGRASELAAPAAPSALRQLDRLEDGAAAADPIPSPGPAASMAKRGSAVSYNPMLMVMKK